MYRLCPPPHAGAEENDIAIIELPQPLDLSQSCVEPVCLDPDFNPEGQQCVVTGWGTTSCKLMMRVMMMMMVVVVVMMMMMVMMVMMVMIINNNNEEL